MDQQNSCKTLAMIGVHLTMHLMYPNYGLTGSLLVNIILEKACLF